MEKGKHKIDLVEYLENRYIKTEKQRRSYEKAYSDAEIASKIYDLRQQAGLTQKKLAELVGTKQPVISRLEDADYGGHSLEMLRKIAFALHCRVEVNIVPATSLPATKRKKASA